MKKFINIIVWVISLVLGAGGGAGYVWSQWL